MNLYSIIYRMPWQCKVEEVLLSSAGRPLVPCVNVPFIPSNADLVYLQTGKCITHEAMHHLLFLLPTPSGLTWRTLSPMQLGSPWGTSWCMMSFNSTAASSLASVPPYASPDLAVSTKLKNGWGSSNGGRGCHFEE